MQTTLADLRKIGEALNIITTEIQINPYWRYSKLLNEEEVLEFHFAGKLYGMRSHKYKKVVEGAKKLIQDC